MKLSIYPTEGQFYGTFYRERAAKQWSFIKMIHELNIIKHVKSTDVNNVYFKNFKRFYLFVVKTSVKFLYNTLSASTLRTFKRLA